jgi:hypothetical protein
MVNAASLQLAASVIGPLSIQQGQTFSAGNPRAITRSNPFHLRPMSGFLIARVTQHHAIVIESVQITFPPFILAHLLSPCCPIASMSILLPSYEWDW